MDNLQYGIKELYDVVLRVNNPIDIGNKKLLINEAILKFETVEMSTITENKQKTQSKGGFQNKMLIDWEIDKEMRFFISNGVLSSVSWAILSNSQIKDEKTKSVSYNETIKCIETNYYSTAILKYIPNHINILWGAQGYDENGKLPERRENELELKPLPPTKDKFIFIYDVETGKRIDNFYIIGNKLFIDKGIREIYVDYTFNYEDKIKVIEVGNRLINGFLSLTGKMSVKDDESGEVTTAILEIPKIKLSSSLSMRLGKGQDKAVVSDFYFVGYPDDTAPKGKQFVSKITFLDKELTGDYI